MFPWSATSFSRKAVASERPDGPPPSETGRNGAAAPLPVPLRLRLRLVLDGDDPVYGRIVPIVIQVLIIVSVLTIALETVPGLPAWTDTFFFVEESVMVAIFLTEYVLRIYSSERPFRYILSFYGIIDFLAIAPSLLLVGLDVRSIRVLRVVRVLRLLKLMRYVRAFERLARALKAVADELIVFVIVVAIMLYLCATAVYLFENTAQPQAFASIPHAMWWAVVTFTTVGYGDVYPITTGGRIFTGVLLILALGVVAVPTGLIATALTHNRELEAKREEEEEAEAMKRKGDIPD